ncbi:MAG: DUF1553 domain-containing protein, partial [Verrucomicrobiota bacterium]
GAQGRPSFCDEQRKLDPSLGPDGFNQQFRLIVSVNQHEVWDDPKKILALPHDYKYDDGKPDDVVEPLTLFGEAVDTAKFDTPREAFAHWLTSKENPMFALTAANRFWASAFGLGLHEPLDDIDEIKRAQNPELLAYLADYLKDLDFNRKEFLRAIYYSDAWQRQATLSGPTQVEISRNQYHFPGPTLQRMSAEQLWDSFLTLTVPDPMKFKRDVVDDLVAHIKFDIKDVDGQSSNDRIAALREIVTKTYHNGAPSLDGWQETHSVVDADGSIIKYSGAYLTRASEQIQPASASSFLAAWGQSDRILVDNADEDGSIPQVLTMLNGTFTQMLIKPDSHIFKTVGGQRGSGNKTENIYLSILSRYPEGKENAISQRAIRGSDEGYGDLIWALVNTREFIFIK